MLMQFLGFGVRGLGLGNMGCIVLGLLLQEPVSKRFFFFQPNKLIWVVLFFSVFFFLEDEDVPLIQGFSDDEPLVTA